MKILVVEDQDSHQKQIVREIKEFNENIEISIHERVEGLADKIQDLQPDLIFLDVELPDGKSTDYMSDFLTSETSIIFTTAHEKYAIDAFRISAVDFIIKPIDGDEVHKAIKKALEDKNFENQKIKVKALLSNLSKKNKKILINTNAQLYVLSPSQIVYCEAKSSYTVFHCSDQQEIISTTTLKEFDESLSDIGFFRIHKSYLLNLDFVESMVKSPDLSIKLSTGIVLPISKSRKDFFLSALENNIKK
ncbi:MAG: LytTR family DNA-binding domain-containing protein [Flavobacteriales bacterium]|nr:LytTR family DNA-binding domain-containing protein [Flavobacteriales bacterium]